MDMQPPMPPAMNPAASPYQPPANMAKGSMYSFQKWLMIGLIVLVFSTIFAEFPLSSSSPNASDYDLLTEKGIDDFAEANDSFEGQVALFAAMSAILQTTALSLVAYAFIREAHEEEGMHVAMRVTMVLAAIILVTSMVGRNFSLF
ncbi:hypothetical protein N9L22_03405 [Candidatus Poseidonia alphae]|nr:hypothetical protein [Candidatus Poseidonia alphae]